MRKGNLRLTWHFHKFIAWRAFLFLLLNMFLKGRRNPSSFALLSDEVEHRRSGRVSQDLVKVVVFSSVTFVFQPSRSQGRTMNVDWELVITFPFS